MDSDSKALILILDDQPYKLGTMMGYMRESDYCYKFLQGMNEQK